MRFAKGHGTGNDFVILPDPDAALTLTPQLVRRLCHRRFGIGGDGVLRVVRSAKRPDAVHLAGEAEWFMDYHNADGSLSEMCGNGVRVFARYLTQTGLVSAASFPIATRSGRVDVLVVADDDITVSMPPPVVGGYASAREHRSGRTFAGTRVDVGNPHLVCPVDELESLDLSAPPGYDHHEYPSGVNVEFMVPAEPVEGADVHVRMRVFERGSGETLSCGSGACAVAAVALRDAGVVHGIAVVDVPGGRLTVTIAGGHCALGGPAVVVATGDVLD